MHRPAPLTSCERTHLPLHEDPSYNVTELPCRVEQRTHNTERVPREHSLCLSPLSKLPLENNRNYTCFSFANSCLPWLTLRTNTTLCHWKRNNLKWCSSVLLPARALCTARLSDAVSYKQHVQLPQQRELRKVCCNC